MGRLDGKVAIVSGAARGQGEAEARLFADEGAKVVLGDVLDEEGGTVAKDIGDAARFVHLDVSKEADWAAAIGAARELGPLNVLVNNAAIIRPAAIEDTTLDEYRAVIDVNQIGCFLGMRSAIAPMREAGGGSIVNISSIAGIGQSLMQEPAYAASKGAIRIFTKVTAAQHAKDKIRCNSIHPGPVDTEMFHSAFPDRAVMERRLQRIPLGRMGTVAEIVAAVIYFASDDSAYTTGSELLIDGGAMAQ